MFKGNDVQRILIHVHEEREVDWKVSKQRPFGIVGALK